MRHDNERNYTETEIKTESENQIQRERERDRQTERDSESKIDSKIQRGRSSTCSVTGTQCSLGTG